MFGINRIRFEFGNVLDIWISFIFIIIIIFGVVKFDLLNIIKKKIPTV